MSGSDKYDKVKQASEKAYEQIYKEHLGRWFSLIASDGDDLIIGQLEARGSFVWVIVAEAVDDISELIASFSTEEDAHKHLEILESVNFKPTKYLTIYSIPHIKVDKDES